MAERLVKWRDSTGVHEGTVVAAVVKKNETYLVLNCLDGVIREVQIENIKPI